MSYRYIQFHCMIYLFLNNSVQWYWQATVVLGLLRFWLLNANTLISHGCDTLQFWKHWEDRYLLRYILHDVDDEITYTNRKIITCKIGI